MSENIDKNWFSNSNCFFFYWALTGCFNQSDCDFDDSSKVG